MLMFDRISEIAEVGGDYGKGLVRAVLDLKPDLWFFPCHFKAIRSCPAAWASMRCGSCSASFSAGSARRAGAARSGLGELKLSGQILPTVKQVVYGIDVKRVMRSKLVLGIADGWLSADGAIIYRARTSRSVCSARWRRTPPDRSRPDPRL